MFFDSHDGRRLMVGESPRTRHVLRGIDRVAKGRWPVLILGETGTGKELASRSIHEKSSEGPFVTIDCSSLVGPLMESELFGHARGAFTGASYAKEGLLAMADGGTAFFDEIGELPLDMQGKLLRALQEKEFRPVGSTKTHRSDFRIIAATNRDLQREVERGNFRGDLYFRLNVVTIKLPPLRDRKEDIPALAAHFLTKYGANHSFSEEAMAVLDGYSWPGNIRELENCVQRMVAMNSGPVLHVADLPSAIRNAGEARRWESETAEAPKNSLAPAVPLRLDAAEDRSTGIPRVPPGREGLQAAIVPLAELERRAIADALRYTRGDRNLAATLLGIGRTTLYRKIKEYDRLVV